MYLFIFLLQIRSFDLVEETDRGTGYLIEIVSAIVIICLVLLGALLVSSLFWKT